eukprot:symbB.v1.2.020972.t2/scaffold1791.1/size101237/12
MVFYTGREWTIHKQAGMQVRRVPAFWNNLFNISMIFMYMAIGVTVFGLIEMQQPKELVEEGGEVPMSAGIFCSNALLVLYLSLYAALQIAKTLDVEFRERGNRLNLKCVRRKPWHLFARHSRCLSHRSLQVCY